MINVATVVLIRERMETRSRLSFSEAKLTSLGRIFQFHRRITIDSLKNVWETRRCSWSLHYHIRRCTRTSWDFMNLLFLLKPYSSPLAIVTKQMRFDVRNYASVVASDKVQKRLIVLISNSINLTNYALIALRSKQSSGTNEQRFFINFQQFLAKMLSFFNRYNN